MQVDSEQFKSLLLDAGLIKQADLKVVEKKAKKQKVSLQDVLAVEGLVPQEDLIKMEAYVLGVPFINLEKEKIDSEVLKIIPEPIAKSHNIIAFRKRGKDLEVAMLDPDDLA
ncbi:hypothetical protein IIC44_02240, partial [Patescibacteria group bacterium]|nr:hypothetical protein [Patescibacteria group bacterium]